MLKGRDQIGKRVIAVDTGEEIDKVRDVVFDQDANEVLGFLLDEGGLFSAAQIVPFSCVRAVGPDAMLVSDKSEWKAADTAVAAQRVLKGDKVLKGTTLMTTDGRDLGKIMDLYFDDNTGRLTGYEVSGGMFADAYSGRSFVPAPKSMTLGPDVAVVPAETADLMEEQPGGVKGAVQQVADRAGHAVGATAAKVKEVSVASAERAGHAIGATAAKVKEVSVASAERAGHAIGATAAKVKEVTVASTERAGHAMGATAAKVKEVSVVSAERAGHAMGATAAKVKEVSVASAERAGHAMGATAAKVKEVSVASAERVEHAMGATAAKVKEAGLASAERAQALGQKISDTATNAVVTSDDQLAFALGKTTREAVQGADGQTLVAEGTVVTAEMADDAQRHAALGRLYKATGGTRDRLGMGVDQVHGERGRIGHVERHHGGDGASSPRGGQGAAYPASGSHGSGIHHRRARHDRVRRRHSAGP